MQRGESLEAVKDVVQIWEGFDLAGVAKAFDMDSREVRDALRTMKRFIQVRTEAGPCPGCFLGGSPFETCSILQCVQSKGYWTCAECGEFTGDPSNACPHSDASENPMGSRHRASKFICKRYRGTNVENLARCREIGYAAFVEEIKQRVAEGWRSWHVIAPLKP